MPKSKACPHYFSIIFAVCAMAILLSEQLSWSESYKDILELEYSSVSGMTGRESVLKIYNDGNVYYQTDGGYKYDGTKTDYSKKVINFTNSTTTLTERRRLKNVLESNKFFSLEDSYMAKYPISDKGGSCIKVSKPLNKTVCAEDGSNVPESYYNIVREVDQISDRIIKRLPKNYLAVKTKYKLKQWPYSYKIKLSEVRDKSFLDEELFNYFVNLLKEKNVLSSEDDLVFLPYITCQGLPFVEFSKNSDCRFNLHSGKIIIWPTRFNVRLSEIGGERVFIGNEKYQQIKGVMETAVGYLDVFIENNIFQDTYAYRLGLELSWGQKIEEVKRKNK